MKAIVFLMAMLMTLPAMGQLVSQTDERGLRELLPNATGELAQILEDPELIFYTEREMPRAYQKWRGGLHGIHSPAYNISGDAREKAKGNGNGGNGNVEFPWRDGGGISRGSNAQTFKFIKLPVDGNGQRLPIVWYRVRLPNNDEASYSWLFPRGTIVGEILTVHNGRNHYPFEVRIRTRHLTHWEPKVYRPFPTRQRLQDVLENLPSELHRNNPQITRLISQLRNPKLIRRTVDDRQHVNQMAFRQTANVHSLYPLPSEIVKALLMKDFEEATGEAWARDCHAPTTRSNFHIVPKDYFASHIAANVDSCHRCHESTNQHVRTFDMARDWYGQVRGADGIFSFHPFARSSISHDGSSRPVQFNRALTQNGIVVAFNPQRHTQNIYARITSFIEGRGVRMGARPRGFTPTIINGRPRSRPSNFSGRSTFRGFSGGGGGCAGGG